GKTVQQVRFGEIFPDARQSARGDREAVICRGVGICGYQPRTVDVPRFSGAEAAIERGLPLCNLAPVISARGLAGPELDVLPSAGITGKQLDLFGHPGR